MANTDHVIENKLHKQASTGTAHHRLIAIVLLLGAIGSFLLFKGNLFPPTALAIGAIFFFFSRSAPDATITAGAVGEDQAMSVLSALPDTYTLFNQLDIPNEKSSTGANEADVVVCGPTAIFIIEVKNNNGTIFCEEGAPQWKVSKVGRRGGEYEKDMRNPIAQTKKLVWLLGEHLKKTNSKPWIQGIVLFTNPEVELEFNDQTSMPVLRPAELLSFMTSFQSNSRPDVMARAKEQIVELRRRPSGNV